jgi:hypothetical protein
VPFETGLNLLWACVAAAALGVLVWSEFACRHESTRAARASRSLAVLFAVLFLFPCVSASDDLLTLQNLQFTLETADEIRHSLPHRSPESRSGVRLAQFFEALQTFPLAALYALLLTLLLLAFLAPAAASACNLRVPAVCGRAPPVTL